MSNSKKIRVGIVGATGYTGLELVRLLCAHPHASVEGLTTRSYAGQNISDIFPSLRGSISLQCSDENLDALSKRCEVIFLALPHGEAASMVTAEVLERCKIIDLGADFRLEDPSEYKEWYHLEHPNKALIPNAVYGLSELNKDKIKTARLLANPGCYATCSILALTPLLKHNLVDANTIIVDAKSGVSGAGRALALGSHFNETNESFKAYAVASHRHTPEIEQALKHYSGVSTKLSFTPHLVPMNRGILVTAYASLSNSTTIQDLKSAYSNTYEGMRFIRLFDSEAQASILPETRWVKGSNFCDIFYKIDKRTNRVIVIAALDNLVKGAAGQAIQNMNLMCDFDEDLGLKEAALFP